MTPSVWSGNPKQSEFHWVIHVLEILDVPKLADVDGMMSESGDTLLGKFYGVFSLLIYFSLT